MRTTLSNFWYLGTATWCQPALLGMPSSATEPERWSGSTVLTRRTKLKISTSTRQWSESMCRRSLWSVFRVRDFDNPYQGSPAATRPSRYIGCENSHPDSTKPIRCNLFPQKKAPFIRRGRASWCVPQYSNRHRQWLERPTSGDRRDGRGSLQGRA